MRETYFKLTFLVSWFKRRLSYLFLLFCMLVAVLRVITLTHLPSFTVLTEYFSLLLALFKSNEYYMDMS